jgi:hypothetical protein
MPLIKPRTERTTTVRHITKLWTENAEQLYAYAAFIGESPAYVLNALIDQLKADKDFKVWRADHSGSFMPADDNNTAAAVAHPSVLRKRGTGQTNGIAPRV